MAITKEKLQSVLLQNLNKIKGLKKSLVKMKALTVFLGLLSMVAVSYAATGKPSKILIK